MSSPMLQLVPRRNPAPRPLLARAHSSLTCGLAALALLASCGGSDEPIESAPPSLLRLTEVAVEATPLDRTERIVAAGVVLRKTETSANFQLVRGLDPESSRKIVRRVPGVEKDGKRALAFGGSLAGPRVIALPVANDIQSIRTVQAVVYTPGPGILRARAVLLDSEDAVHRASDWAEFGRGNDPRSLEFTLAPPSSAPDGVTLDRVAIEFDGRAGFASVLQMIAAASAAGAELPPVGSPEIVALFEETRIAAGLVEGHAWSIETDLGEGAQFHASVHRPAAYRAEGGDPRLSVTVRRDGMRNSVNVPLEGAVDRNWAHVSVPLPGQMGPGSTVEIELIDEREGASAVLLGDAAIGTPKAKPRTVLFITSDTHRADYIGVARTPSLVTTPTIDALARRGLNFEDCQSTTNITNPSHIAMMTGIHPRDTGIVNNWTQLAAQATTLAESFADDGFRTFACVSVRHLTHRFSGLGQGFDRHAIPINSGQDGALSIDRLASWVPDADGQDLFLWLHIFDAHTPYSDRRAAGANTSTSGDSAIRAEDLHSKSVPGWIQTSGASSREELRGWYKTEVEALDSALQRLVSVPRIDSGWVAFTADHGEGLGENDVWFTHTGLYAPTVQVPLLISGPGIDAKRTSASVQQVHVGRTLLDLAGVDAPFPGQNLVARSDDPDTDEPRFGLSSNANQASITSGPWLLTLDLLSQNELPKELRQYEAGTVRIFDRRAGSEYDPALLEEEWDRAVAMRARLIQWLGEEPEVQVASSEITLNESDAAEMKALGYSDSTAKRGSSWWDESNVAETEWLTRFAGDE